MTLRHFAKWFEYKDGNFFRETAYFFYVKSSTISIH